MDAFLETTPGPTFRLPLGSQYADALIDGGRTGLPSFSPVQFPVSLSEPLTLKFKILAERWRLETRSLSVLTKIVTNPAYQQIIGMGEAAVPLILRELRERPAHWFWALQAITGEDPTPEGADFRGAVDAWLGYGRLHGLLT
jgi:hypothetical protein